MDKLKGERGGLTARCGRGRAVVERRRGVVDGGAVVNGGAVVERRRAHGARGRAARWSRAARAVAARRRRGRDEAVVEGGATENLGSTSPAISLLRAKCRSARRRRGGYILQRVIGPGPWHRPGPMTHWSRAMPRPGTDDPQ